MRRRIRRPFIAVLSVTVGALGISLTAGPSAIATPPPTGVSATGTELLTRPPHTVTRAQLARALARAERATQGALPHGARIRGTERGFGDAGSTTTIRTRGTRFVRSAQGERHINDNATDRELTPMSDVARYFGVTAAKLAAALQSLGRPHARWMSGPIDTYGVDVALPSSNPYERVTRLGQLDRLATGWTWSRRHGITTWRITGPFPASWLPGTFIATVVLDRHGRVLRDTWTQTWLGNVSTLRTTISYGHVRPISWPPTTLIVDERELGTALGIAMPDGTVGE